MFDLISSSDLAHLHMVYDCCTVCPIVGADSRGAPLPREMPLIAHTAPHSSMALAA